MSDLPATRAEALFFGLTRYFTGQPCKHGHIAERRAKGDCVECVRERSRRWAKANPEKVCEWRAANPEKARENNRRYREANPEKARERSRQWAEANPEKKRERGRQYREANRDKRNAFKAARRARKLNATPPWADLKAIESVYAERARIAADTGVAYHVDHIVPLKGRNVCGLHVPWNLRVIPATENMAKGNR